MKRTVAWSDPAKSDIRAILAFVAEYDADSADRLIDEIESGGTSLGNYDTGRPGRMPGTKEKSLTDLGYILSYRIERSGDRITILRVVHARQNWPKNRWPKKPSSP